MSYNKIGDVLVDQGDLPEALESFREGLEIADRLAKADPGNAGWQRDLAISNERVGDISLEQGNEREARQAFERALAAYGVLISRNPGDVQSQLFSVVPRLRLAALDPPGARGHLEAALAILRPLAEANRLAMRLEWKPAIEGELAAMKN